MAKAKIEFEDETFFPVPHIEPVQWLHVPLKEHIKASAPRIYGALHLFLHCTYLGTVYFEGDGIHSWSAALLMAVTIVGVGVGYKVAAESE